MTVGEKIKYLRKTKGLTQVSLASTLNVSRAVVARWENGTAFPNLDNVNKLSKFFDVPTDYFIPQNDYVTTTETENIIAEKVVLQINQQKNELDIKNTKVGIGWKIGLAISISVGIVCLFFNYYVIIMLSSSPPPDPSAICFITCDFKDFALITFPLLISTASIVFFAIKIVQIRLRKLQET